MIFKSAKQSLIKDLEEIKAAGLWKTERVIASEQKNDITLADGSEVINMCANNYLGLANNPEVIQAAKDSYDQWGFGLASVRFICGTQSIHKTLEEKVDSLQESLDFLRLCIKYQSYDLEATRRENRYLKKLLDQDT